MNAAVVQSAPVMLTVRIHLAASVARAVMDLQGMDSQAVPVTSMSP